jgi:hypothetical protein
MNRQESVADRADTDLGAKLFGDQIRNFADGPIYRGAHGPP